MYNKGMFIKYIKKDENNRILISVKDHFVEKLTEKETQQEIKKILISTLEDDFKQLEVGKNMLRVSVHKNPDECIEKINNYINQMLEMAEQFMNNMGK